MANKKIQRPLNVMFVITSMPVGGAETLLSNMLYQFDPERIHPLVCCLKNKDELGEKIEGDFKVFSNLINGKFDLAVVHRLKSLMQQERVDAIVTVGAGDKMFWGRLAAKYAGVPVILSALHSTGWPDGIGTLNRLLTRITTGFIAVAEAHGKHLVEHEGFPVDRVFVIPNGVDSDRFQFDSVARKSWRKKLGIPSHSPVVGIVAALRQEKNHSLFVEAASSVRANIPNAHFVIVGDGPERNGIEKRIAELGLEDCVRLVGCTHDVPGVLSMIDLFALTSDNEASPVSILEAMCCERPVVATDVGSVKESVIEGVTGHLVEAGNVGQLSERWSQLLSDRELNCRFGQAGRDHVLGTSSLNSMTMGYTELVEKLFHRRHPLPVADCSRALNTAIQQTIS